MAERPPEIHQALEALRRTQILDAAAQIFAESGYHAARVQDIARAAGVAHGTVYNYFSNKEALLLGLLDRLNETERRPAMLSRLSGGSARGAIAATLRHRLQLLAENEALLRALLPELLVNASLRQRYLEQVVDPSMRLGEQALAQHAPPERAAALARAMAASALGLVMLRILGESGVREGTDAEVEVMAEAFAALLPEEAR